MPHLLAPLTTFLTFFTVANARELGHLGEPKPLVEPSARGATGSRADAGLEGGPRRVGPQEAEQRESSGRGRRLVPPRKHKPAQATEPLSLSASPPPSPAFEQERLAPAAPQEAPASPCVQASSASCSEDASTMPAHGPAFIGPLTRCQAGVVQAFERGVGRLERAGMPVTVMPGRRGSQSIYVASAHDAMGEATEVSRETSAAFKTAVGMVRRLAKNCTSVLWGAETTSASDSMMAAYQANPAGPTTRSFTIDVPAEVFTPLVSSVGPFTAQEPLGEHRLYVLSRLHGIGNVHARGCDNEALARASFVGNFYEQLHDPLPAGVAPICLELAGVSARTSPGLELRDQECVEWAENAGPNDAIVFTRGSSHAASHLPLGRHRDIHTVVIDLPAAEQQIRENDRVTCREFRAAGSACDNALQPQFMRLLARTCDPRPPPGHQAAAHLPVP